MNEQQEKVVKLLNQEVPKDKLRPWIKGYIPHHFRRLSISMEEAEELAALGAAESIAFFGESLYFTQSVIVGAAISRRYRHLVIVTPSQYGKSWTMGQIALLLANQGHPVYVAGADTSTTEIIMNKVIDHIQSADVSIKSKFLETQGKLEKLQTSLSKRKLAFKGGGLIEALSLGEIYADAKKGNTAIGRGGDFLIDEASRVSDDTYAELGRAEFASEGEQPFLRIEISNPHNPGRFFDALTDTDPPDDTLIVWIDALTSLEEGRIKSREQILRSEFFKNKSTCTRYLLCELENYSEESMFPEPVVNDDPLSQTGQWFLGVDSAYKGKDNVEMVLAQMDPEKGLRFVSRTVVPTTPWVDGETSQRVIKKVALVIKAYGINAAAVDIGFGIWLVEGLVRECPNTRIIAVNFGSGTTKVRKEMKHFAAVNGDNRRAEMHLDLQDLMEHDMASFSSELLEEIKDQMAVVRSIHKPNGKIAVVPKKEIRKVLGKSPDALDGVILAGYACITETMHEVTQIYDDPTEQREVT